MLRPIAAAYHAKIMESISKPYAMITRSGRCSGVPVIRRRLFGPVLGRGGRTSGSPDGTKGVRCQKQRSAGVLLAGLRPVRAPTSDGILPDSLPGFTRDSLRIHRPPYKASWLVAEAALEHQGGRREEMDPILYWNEVALGANR